MKINHIISTCTGISFILLLSVSPLAYADQWKGYVCKVMDMGEWNKGNKRIYPRSERYDDKATCYEEFEKLYVADPEMNRLYPQTNNAYTRFSLAFGKPVLLFTRTGLLYVPNSMSQTGKSA